MLTGSMVQVKVAIPFAPAASVTVTVTLEVPAVVGVLGIRPVAELIARPCGAGWRCR